MDFSTEFVALRGGRKKMFAEKQAPLCDENRDAELARQVKIARQDRRIDAFFYTSVTHGHLTAAIDAL